MCAQVDDRLFSIPANHKEVISRIDGAEEIVLTRKLGGGGPETAVYLVDIRSPLMDLVGSRVLKLYSTWRARNEAKYHLEIKASSLGRYVPEIAYSILGENDQDLSAIVYSLATGSFINSQTLEALITKRTYQSAQVLKGIAQACWQPAKVGHFC